MLEQQQRGGYPQNSQLPHPSLPIYKQPQQQHQHQQQQQQQMLSQFTPLLAQPDHMSGPGGLPFPSHIPAGSMPLPPHGMGGPGLGAMHHHTDPLGTFQMLQMQQQMQMMAAMGALGPGPHPDAQMHVGQMQMGTGVMPGLGFGMGPSMRPPFPPPSSAPRERAAPLPTLNDREFPSLVEALNKDFPPLAKSQQSAPASAPVSASASGGPGAGSGRERSASAGSGGGGGRQRSVSGSSSISSNPMLNAPLLAVGDEPTQYTSSGAELSAGARPFVPLFGGAAPAPGLLTGLGGHGSGSSGSLGSHLGLGVGSGPGSSPWTAPNQNYSLPLLSGASSAFASPGSLLGPFGSAGSSVPQYEDPLLSGFGMGQGYQFENMDGLDALGIDTGASLVSGVLDSPNGSPDRSNKQS